MPNRGEIWLANLNPKHGTEPGKTRPVLIVQAQALLDAQHPSTLVIPLTTKLIDDAEPLRLRLTPTNRLRRVSDLFSFAEYPVACCGELHWSINFERSTTGG